MKKDGRRGKVKKRKRGRPLPDKPSYRIDELQELWDVSEKTISRWISEGKLRAFKKGHTVRVFLSDRRRFEEAHMTR